MRIDATFASEVDRLSSYPNPEKPITKSNENRPFSFIHIHEKARLKSVPKPIQSLKSYRRPIWKPFAHHSPPDYIDPGRKAGIFIYNFAHQLFIQLKHAMETFELEVFYKDKEIHFAARLLTLGYIYKIEVDINTHTVVFERDEERNWRALIDPSLPGFEKIDRELVQVIGHAIEEATQ